MKNNDAHDRRGGCTSTFISLNIFLFFFYTRVIRSYVRKRLTKFMSAREFMGERGIARGPQRFRNDRHSVAIRTRRFRFRRPHDTSPDREVRRRVGIPQTAYQKYTNLLPTVLSLRIKRSTCTCSRLPRTGIS